jgi:cyanate permease
LNKHKIFFGWWTVLACGIIGFVGVGFGFHGFSVLFKPLAAELELSRAATSMAVSIAAVMGGLAGPLGGWANDKYGPRRVMLIGIIILATGFTAMFFVNSLLSFLFAWGVVVGLGVALGPAIMTDRAIVNWFVRKSGMAVNLKFAIQALAGISLVPLIAWLVTGQGWRITYLVGAAAVLLITIPLTWFFIKPHRPEYYGLLPDGVYKPVQTNDRFAIETDSVISEFTFRQTIRTPAYRLVIVTGWITLLIYPMMTTHFVPFLTDRGIAPVLAASMFGVIYLINIPGRLIGGYFADRSPARRLPYIIALGYLIQACGVLVYLVREDITSIYVWIIFFGFGDGITRSIAFPLMVRYFGRISFGSITGLTSMLNIPFNLLAPIYIGWIFDTSGSYSRFIVLIPVLQIIASIVACFIRRPKPQLKATGLVDIID